MKESKSTNKKQLAVIAGTNETGKILSKQGHKNALIVSEIYTSKYGKVSTAILVTETMIEEEAKKLLEAWWIETSGNKFASWQSIDRYEESTVTNNFHLSNVEQQSFLIDLMKMLGLENLTKKAIFNLINKAESGNKTAIAVKKIMKDMGINAHQ